MKLETKKEEEDRKVEARPENDKTEEARREVVNLSRILLATQGTPPDNDDVVTRAVDMTGSAVTVATPFLQSS